MRGDDQRAALYRGTDKLLFGIILGVLAFWLFAQTTLNIAPAMAVEDTHRSTEWFYCMRMTGLIVIPFSLSAAA